MPRKTIMVVDDEKDVRELVRYNLDQAGYRWSLAVSGEAALKQIRAQLPDLILLDLMLPGIDGLEVCRMLKRDPRTAAIPVIMLTAKGEEVDIVTGLEMGAEDYVVKPFSPRVLLARIRSLLRRRQPYDPSSGMPIRHDRLLIDPQRHEIKVDDQAVVLTYSEFMLLRYLAGSPGRVHTRKQIIEAVHGDDYPVTERSIDVQVVNLRRKLGPVGDRIDTVRGIGYRFKEL